MRLGLFSTALVASRLFSQSKVSRVGKRMDRGMKSSCEGNSFTDKDGTQPLSCSPFQGDYKEEFPSIADSLSSAQSKRKARLNLHAPHKQNPEKVQNIDTLQPEVSTSTSSPNGTDSSSSLGEARSCSSGNPRTKIDLCTPPEQKPEEVQNNAPLQLEASNSEGNLYDTDLPPGFWKNRSSRSLKFKEAFHEYQGRNYSSRNLKHQKPYHEHHKKRNSMTFSRGTSVGQPFDICFPDARESNTSISSVEIEKSNEDMKKSDDTEGSLEEPWQRLRPGMVLLKHYISLSEQVDIVNRCRELGCGPGGFYQPGYSDGAKLHLYMMCLGLDWDPQTRSYGERRYHDNAAPPVIPQEFTSLVCRGIHDSHNLIKRETKTINVEDELPPMSPDLCIVNFYTTTGRLGLHQDRDESGESLDKELPVVSISVGDTAVFLYGDGRAVDKAKQVLLESGDVLIFGGKSRHVFHGVKTIIPDTAPPALLKRTKLRPGRLNLTFRKH